MSSVETTYSTYEYDAAGNQTRIIPPAPSGQTVNVYDFANRLVFSTDGANQTTGHQYDLAGKETTTTLATGVVKTAVYDTAGRLKQTGDGTTTVGYDYDIQGNTIKQSESPRGLTEAPFPGY